MSPIYFQPQVTRFVTLFVERSGSTYLATLLAAHPDILSRREEFSQLRQRGQDGAGQLAWAREFFTPPLFGNHKAYGFKTKIVDILDPNGFAQLLHQSHCHIIQLHRQNAVKAVVSTINAKRLYEVSGNWNLLNEADRMSAFSVDLEEFERLLQQRKEWDDELENFVKPLHLPTLKLFYEDMLLDESAFMHKVFDFIRVRYAPVKGKTLKNTQDNLREAILNFDELREKYTGTIYESMFSEVLV